MGTSPITSDREINLQWKTKKFAVRLLPRKLKKLSHRTLLYPTSTHFYPTMMMLEVAKTIQIKPETEINPSPGFSTKKISSNRRLQQILHTTLLFLKQDI